MCLSTKQHQVTIRLSPETNWVHDEDDDEDDDELF